MDLNDLSRPLGEVALPSGIVIVPEGAIRMNDPSAKIRLSHSTNALMHSCERKFQKTKLLLTRASREESPAMCFGKGFGAAVQHYMVLRTMGETAQVAIDSAIYEGTINWGPAEVKDDRRFLERLIHVIQLSQNFSERMLMEWEIAQFNGRFATELSFRIDINERYYFVGYIDLVLRNIKTRRFAPTDYKTTSLNGEDLTPNFKYSDQVLGYSIVLDAIVGTQLSDFDVNYWVAQLANHGKAALWEAQFKDYSFPKTLRDRFEWFLKLYLDVNYMESLKDLEVYPRRNACRAYNRTCQFFGECQFTETDQFAPYIEDDTVYDFTFNLNELFTDHQERLNILARG